MDFGLSLIIPCYNAGVFLQDAVDSILKQACNINFEIIVVDDGSTDIETRRVLNNLDSINKILVIRNSQNRGSQYSRNVGIEQSQYKYLMTLDSDDCLKLNVMVDEKNYLQHGIEVLEKDEDLVFVHGLSQMFGDYSGYTISSYPISENLAVNKHHIPTSIIFRKNDALTANLYDLSIEKWQDWSFGVALMNSRYMQNKKNHVHFVNEVVHLYRIHTKTNRISSNEVSEYEMTRLTIFNNESIFRSYFPNITKENIALKLMENKPDRLIDLLYVANTDIRKAIEIVKQRNYNLNDYDIHKMVP